MANENNLDSILAQLEGTKSAEDTFQEKIAGLNTESNLVEEIKLAELEEVSLSSDDMEKVAEYVEKGKIMAHAFMEELTKIASNMEATSEVEDSEEFVEATEKTAGANNEAVEILESLYNLNF
jgi:hypothetical protein